MNSSCDPKTSTNVVMTFYILGGFLTIIGTLLNLCSCFLFTHFKSILHTPCAIFIIGLSIADIVKLTAEYTVHILFFFIEHPYFVCSITWYVTMVSENTSYAFLCALGIERNVKVWQLDNRFYITRRRAGIITAFIVLVALAYNHLFLFLPNEEIYCYFNLYNKSTLFSCNNARYNAYGFTYYLTTLLLFENIGLNNLILPVIIIVTNVLLIIGLRHRVKQRQNRLKKSKTNHLRERSLINYMLFSSLTFLILTLPIGILGAWSGLKHETIPTSNLSLVLDLMEIIHHCSHFPILLMTSSIIRAKTFQIIFQFNLRRLNSTTSKQSFRQRLFPYSSAKKGATLPQCRFTLTNYSTVS